MIFKQILVPIAPEQKITDSLHQAFQLANKCSSHVTLLSVIKELDEFKEIHHISGTACDLLDKATQFYHNVLKDHVHALRKQYPQIRFATKVRIGIPFIEIIKEADESEASIVIIDSYRKTKKEACQRGSNTLSLMRKSEVPIWCVSKELRAINNVVAAVDLTSADYQDFNTKLIALAIEFCSKIGANLTLCHVWKLESEGFLRDWSGYSDIDIALLSQKMCSERMDRLNSMLIPYMNDSTAPIQVKLLEGEVREILPQYVDDNSVDLVILGSMSRSGVSGFVMGNTAESMINQLGCSVLTLKPDSFKSPILNDDS
ncbi:universal stress protein [Vibrio sp.]|uniref:universal stress protein n=1 Tax=Vibrio sp. TaxID=678 RepID=UPI003D0C70D3